jgi:hypothetical protein
VLLAACQTPPQLQTYVAQRGYLTVETVGTASQVAQIVPSEQTVVRDSEPEGIRLDSWSVIAVVADMPSPVAPPSQPSRLAFTAPEPQMSTAPVKRVPKARKIVVAHKPKAKPADCKPGEEGKS